MDFDVDGLSGLHRFIKNPNLKSITGEANNDKDNNIDIDTKVDTDTSNMLGRTINIIEVELISDRAIKYTDIKFMADKTNNDIDIKVDIGTLGGAIIKTDVELNINKLGGADIIIKKEVYESNLF